jgi:hypothetical protein
MNIAQIASAARMLLPKGSPWLDKIDKAQQLAGQFSSSPDGVRQLMQQMGKTQADVQAAVNALNNPMVSGALNRIAPGLTDQLRAAGQQITGGGMATAGQPLSPASPAPASADPLSAIRDTLNKL